jgi:hypothetical protein
MTPDEWEDIAGPWAYRPVQGGWMLADAEHGERFAVRFAPDEQGRLEPVELRLDSGTSIDSTMLRRLPLMVMRTLANSLIEIREQLAAQQGPFNVPPDGQVADPLDRAAYPHSMLPGHPHAKHASSGAHGQQRVSGTTTGHKVELTDSGSAADALTITKQQSAAMLRRSALFNAPPGPKPDDFYEKVAIAYERLSVRSNRPAAEIHEAVGVPLTTVHRWVKRARQLGYLPPGQKGRRG